jgi:hypothetical protein
MADLRESDVSIITADSELLEPVAHADNAISWAAVAAGAFATAALTLLLTAFGAGMGFSSVSPWANSGISATTFSVGTGIYLIVIAMLSSTVGGYIAGRLRTRWSSVEDDEVFFRDTAHGFMAWACAIVLSAALLGAAATTIVSGATAGLSQQGSNDGGPAAIYVDQLLRPSPAGGAAGAQNQVPPAQRAEVGRLLLKSFRSRSDVTAPDRAYLSQVVASHTGLSQGDADKRVSDVLTQAKSDLDAARSAAAKLSLWLTAALLVGALAASLAAIEGGQLRDRRI